MRISLKTLAANIFYRICKKDMNSECQNDNSTDDLETHLMCTDKVDHKSETETRNDSIKGVGQGSAHSGQKAGHATFIHRSLDDQYANWPQWYGNQQPNQDTFCYQR